MTDRQLLILMSSVNDKQSVMIRALIDELAQYKDISEEEKKFEGLANKIDQWGRK